jgi:hypothetical protein
MDLGSAWEHCQHAVGILACGEGTVEQRVRTAFQETLIPAKLYLPERYLSELQFTERALAEDGPLTTEEAWSHAMGILYIANGITWRYILDEVVPRRWEEGEGPIPLPKPPSVN